MGSYTRCRKQGTTRCLRGGRRSALAPNWSGASAVEPVYCCRRRGADYSADKRGQTWASIVLLVPEQGDVSECGWRIDRSDGEPVDARRRKCQLADNADTESRAHERHQCRGMISQVRNIQGFGCLAGRVPEVEPATVVRATARIADQRSFLQVVDRDIRCGGEVVVVSHDGNDRLAPQRPLCETRIEHGRL